MHRRLPNQWTTRQDRVWKGTYQGGGRRGRLRRPNDPNLSCLGRADPPVRSQIINLEAEKEHVGEQLGAAPWAGRPRARAAGASSGRTVDFGCIRDPFSLVGFDADDALRGRIKARLLGTSVVLPASFGATSLEVGGGVVARPCCMDRPEQRSFVFYLHSGDADGRSVSAAHLRALVSSGLLRPPPRLDYDCTGTASASPCVHTARCFGDAGRAGSEWSLPPCPVPHLIVAGQSRQPRDGAWRQCHRRQPDRRLHHR